MKDLAIGPDDVAAYREFVHEHLGLTFDAAEISAITEALKGRMRQLGMHSATEFCMRLKNASAAPIEIAAAARALTIGETYFFRYPEQFDALSAVALPDCWAQNAALRILSAGCSSGEEAYTLALAALDHPLANAQHTAHILGIDINEDVLRKAEGAGYTAWSLRQDNPLMHSPHLIRDDKVFHLSETLRKCVTFARHNLAHSDDALWKCRPFDIIFCRNVLIYFDAAGVAAVLARLRSILCAGGYLFLGHSESLRGLDSELELMHTHGSFYYRRRLLHTAVRKADWQQAIAASSQRLATFHPPVGRPQVDAPSLSPEVVTAADDKVTQAQVLFDQERFDEALGLLQTQVAAPNVSAALLRAAIFTNKARFSEAEDACQEILQLDSLHAGAYCLLALCKENTGDSAAALQLAATAVALDPQFAMASFYLGQLQHKKGQLAQARQALKRAYDLLHYETAPRLAMFAGGFSRPALMDLCASLLRACAGRP